MTIIGSIISALSMLLLPLAVRTIREIYADAMKPVVARHSTFGVTRDEVEMV